jgi:O-antigen ligase
MNIIALAEKFLPTLLPLLLFFSRTLADSVVILIALLFLFKSYKTKNYEWINNIFIKILIVFLLYLLVVNSIFSKNPYDTLMYSFSFVRWPIFSLAIAYWLLNDLKSLNKFFYSLCAVFIYYLIHIFYQYFIDSSGIFGFSENSFPGRLSIPFSDNVFPGRFLIFISFILISINILKNKINVYSLNSNLIIFILSIGFAGIFFTGERMSFLIYSTSTIFIYLALVLENKKNIIYIFILTPVFLFFIFLVFFFDSEIFNRIIVSTYGKIKYLGQSDYGIVFNTSIEKWKDNYLFGGGLHQFDKILPIYGYGFMGQAKIFHAHNLPLNLLVETGIVGLVIFYSIIIKIILFVFKKFYFTKEYLLFFSCLNLLYISFFPFHTHFKLSHNWINASSWLSIGIIFSIVMIYEQNNKNKKY